MDHGDCTYFLFEALNFPVMDSMAEPHGNAELSRKGPDGRPVRIIDPYDLDPSTKQVTKKERSRYRGLEEFCIMLSGLVQEFKEQISIVIREGILIREEEAGLHPALRQEFFYRYERHRRIFQEVQLERRLDMTYNVVTTVSSKVNSETVVQILALEGLLQVVERGELDYLRKCGVCQRWYLATRSDQLVCSKACRQRKYSANPEYNEYRRKIYAWKKSLKAKKSSARGKKKYA